MFDVQLLLRSCANCGASWGYIDILCEVCWGKLEPLKNHEVQYDLPFPITSLYSWKKEDTIILDKLIFGLKGGCPKEPYTRLSRWLSYERIAQGSLKRPIFIPIPSSRAQHKDHAFMLSFELSRYWGRPMKEALLWDQKGEEQKKLSRLERKCVKMKALKKLKLPSESTIVVVDDVITTGATALAAYEALGEPKRLEFMSLACRPKFHLV